MARVPVTTGRTVTPSATQGGFISVRATPDAFGAAQGRMASAGGQQLTAASDALSKVAQDLRLESEQTYLLEKERAFDGERMRILNDPQSGVLYRRGGDTRGVTARSEAEMDQFIADQMEGVPEHMLPRLEQYAQRWKRSNMGTISTHERTEMTTYNTNLHRSALATASEQGALVYSDSAGGRQAVSELKDRIRRSADKIAELQGWQEGDGQREQLVERNISAMHVGVVNRYIANNQGSAARKYMEENRAELTGMDVSKLEANVARASLNEDTVNTYDSIVAKHQGDFDAQYEEASRIKDADLRVAVEKRIGQQMLIAERLEAEEQERRLESANRKAGTNEPLTAEEETALKATGRFTAWEKENNAILSGNPGVTNKRKEDEWLRLSTAEKAELTDEQMEEWAKHFAVSDASTTVGDIYAQREAAQVARGKANQANQKAARDQRNTYVKATSFNTYADVMNNEIGNLGISKNEKKKAQLRDAVLREIRLQVEQKEAEGRGLSALSDEEVLSITRRLATQIEWGPGRVHDQPIYEISDSDLRGMDRTRVDDLADILHQYNVDEEDARFTKTGTRTVPMVHRDELLAFDNAIKRSSQKMWEDATQREAVIAMYEKNFPRQKERFAKLTKGQQRDIIREYYELARLAQLNSNEEARKKFLSGILD